VVPPSDLVRLSASRTAAGRPARSSARLSLNSATRINRVFEPKARSNLSASNPVQTGQLIVDQDDVVDARLLSNLEAGVLQREEA
jgi:hypothetical protein